jgi:chromatin remodeling complex protein RSC6
MLCLNVFYVHEVGSEHLYEYVKFNELKGINIKNTVFCDLKLCDLIERY